MLQRTFGLGAFAGLAMLASAATAQTKLNWAHVYEVTEPFHTESVWAAEEIGKRTDGRYEIAVFPASRVLEELPAIPTQDAARATKPRRAMAS